MKKLLFCMGANTNPANKGHHLLKHVPVKNACGTLFKNNRTYLFTYMLTMHRVLQYIHMGLLPSISHPTAASVGLHSPKQDY